MMEDIFHKHDNKSDLPALSRKKNRPTQRLYIPPAQRHKKGSGNSNKTNDAISVELTLNVDAPDIKLSNEMHISHPEQSNAIFEMNVQYQQFEQTVNDKVDTECKIIHKTCVNDKLLSEMCKECSTCKSNSESVSDSDDCRQSSYAGIKLQDDSTNEESSLVIMLNNTKMSLDKNYIDVEKQEMERAIVNINRKSRPLIKHVNVGNHDVLQIDVDDNNELNIAKPKPTYKSKKLIKKVDEQISNWEDLFNEDDGFNGEIFEQMEVYTDKTEKSSDEDCSAEKDVEPSDLDHVIELYDFPSTFKTQDLIQLYNGINKESMYIKWCDETHALLVFSTPAQAKQALQVHNDIIKARSMFQASQLATQVAQRCDLKPAMKRPQTSMQTARRLITTHLGTRSRLSKEEQQKEREEIQKAKELKQALRQSENDAWNGHPRPSAV